MKVGLYTISLSGGYYDGPAVPLLEIIRRAREWGYEGVELEGKRPHGNPMDLDDAGRRDVVLAARQTGVELCAVASYNDFSSPIEEHRENELLMVREQIRLAADLGAPIVRVFAAWSGVSRRDGKITYDLARYNVDHRFPGTTQLERWNFVRDTLAEASRIAEAHGVTLALQNHEPIIHGHEEVLEFLDEIGSPALKVSLDFPIMKDKSDAAVRRAVRETGSLMVHSHFGGEYDEAPDGRGGGPVQRKVGRSGAAPASYATFLSESKAQGYQGYLAYELCHPCVVGHRHFGLEEAQAQVVRAARFMRHAIAEARRASTI
jgi:sugar phosphate isomerase/epimerase